MGKKKNFKGGLDGLLSSSVEKPVQPIVVENSQITENSETSEEVVIIPESIGILSERINLMKTELLFWRTGELTPEKFHESLEKNGLYFSENENKILKKENN